MRQPGNPSKLISPDFSIRIDDLSVRAGGYSLLSNASLKITPGEFVAIKGPSGSGKTTLASVIMGLAATEEEKVDGIKVTSGTVCYDDLDVYSLTPSERTKLRCDFFGYAPPSPHLNETKTAWENITLSARLAGKKINNALVKEQADMWQMADRLHTPAGVLSSGEQQRINLLRAVVGSPSVVVLDEPTSQLDPELKADTNQRLSVFANQLGKTVIVITHEASSAKRTINVIGGRVLDVVNKL